MVTAFSTELAWPVIIAPGMSKDLYDGFLEASRCGAQTTLDEALALVPSGTTVSGRIVEGPPSDAILAEAEAIHADLVVVGSRGRGATKSMLLGSVSNRLVHASPVPVLVVHSN